MSQPDVELKSCPFCGQKPEVIRSAMEGAEDSVKCSDEHCPLWGTMGLSDWNTRHAPMDGGGLDKKVYDGLISEWFEKHPKRDFLYPEEIFDIIFAKFALLVKDGEKEIQWPEKKYCSVHKDNSNAFFAHVSRHEECDGCKMNKSYNNAIDDSIAAYENSLDKEGK